MFFKHLWGVFDSLLWMAVDLEVSDLSECFAETPVELILNWIFDLFDPEESGSEPTENLSHFDYYSEQLVDVN